MNAHENVEADPEVVRTEGTHQFTTVSSADIYVGNILALRADHVAMPGGGVARREVVEHPGAVVIVALDDSNRVVVIHQYRYPIDDRLWELPAGLLDVAGEDPVRTAQRELAEEAGLAAEDWVVLADIASSPGFTDESERIYLARGLSTVERSPVVGDEEADLVIRRIPLDEAVRMVFEGQIVNSPAVAGVLAAHAVVEGKVQARPVDASWGIRPTAFVSRLR